MKYILFALLAPLYIALSIQLGPMIVVLMGVEPFGEPDLYDKYMAFFMGLMWPICIFLIAGGALINFDGIGR